MSSSPNRLAGAENPGLIANFDNAWIDQCRARELAERGAAKRASSITARRMHQELAQAYASLALGKPQQ